MSFRTVQLHTCYHPEMGEVRPDKCKCRKLVTVAEALFAIEEGLAKWEEHPTDKVQCPACGGHVTLACAHCGGSGWNPKQPHKFCVHCGLEYFRQNSCPICLGRGTLPKKHVVYSSGAISGGSIVQRIISQKTPRTATIDEKHIRYAYVDGETWAKERIEEWGELARQVQADLIVTYWPEINDPFRGMPVLAGVGNDQRTSMGKNVEVT